MTCLKSEIPKTPLLTNGPSTINNQWIPIIWRKPLLDIKGDQRKGDFLKITQCINLMTEFLAY